MIQKMQICSSYASAGDDVQNNPWKIMLIYIVFGFAWILFSDKLLGMLITDPSKNLQKVLKRRNKEKFFLDWDVFMAKDTSCQNH